MEIWAEVLKVPGMGGAFVLSLITLWLLFLVALVAWIARAPE